MKCKLVRQHLLDYTEHLLDNRMQQHIAHHLDTCRDCSQELEAIQATLKVLSSHSSFQEPPESFWNDFTANVMRKVRTATPPVRPRWSFSAWQMRLAVACALLLVLLSAFAVYRELLSQPPILTTQTDVVGDDRTTEPTIQALVPESVSQNMLETEFALFDDLESLTVDLYSSDPALEGLLLGLSEEEKRTLLRELNHMRAPSP